MKRLIATTLLIFLSLSTQLPGQFRRGMNSQAPRRVRGGQLFHYKIYNFADTLDFNRSRALFHISFVNDILTFIKQADGTYRASYELTVVFYDDDRNPIEEKSHTKKIVVPTFEETNLRTRPLRHRFSFTLPPGEYRYEIQLYDFESEKSLMRKGKLKLKSFSGRIHLSDIILADRARCSDGVADYTPNLLQLFGNPKSAITALFEIYPPADSQDVSLTCSLFDSKGKMLFKKQEEYKGGGKYIPVCLKLRDHISMPGDYYFLVRVRAGSQVADVREKFTVQWRGLSTQEKNIDLAIEQLRVIAGGKELEAMRKAKGAEKQKLYDEFWKKRDPTPDTPENELKEEFLRRVDFANRNFSEPISGLEGWQTDRGRVYIQNGPPDDIEKEPVELNMPTAEIWYYARLNKRYIFSDRDGSGHYRLIKVE